MESVSETTKVLEKVVEFDTTSRYSNRELIDWVADYLDGSGIGIEVLPDHTQSKANLIAVAGPRTTGGIVLCAHTDTVPVDDQDWLSDPFRLTTRNGRLHGRGVVDMKGFLACAVAGMRRLATRNLARPLILALTYDEELGCLGARGIVEPLAAEPPPAAVIVGEATQMRLVSSHKGIRVLRTTITGRDAHSSQTHRGTSAIEAAAMVVSHLRAQAIDKAINGLTVDGFTPAHTTVNVGIIQGGTAMNIVPRHCRIEWEYRSVPGEDIDKFHEALTGITESLTSEHDVEILTEVIADVPPLDQRANRKAYNLVRQITGATPGPPVSYGTDGGVLNAAGFPTVVLGPGEPDQMHQPNESISLEHLAECDRMIESIGDWASED